MSWKIGPLPMPIDPRVAERRVLRKQQAESLLQQFAIPLDTGPTLFELNLKGLVYPPVLANQLWELTKKAEEPTIQIEVLNDPDFEQYSGRYAVNKSSTKQDGPKFTRVAGLDKPVAAYDITFIQFADQGSISDGESLDLDLDEDGIGFDIEDIFGAFDFTDFLNTINDFFTI